MPQYSVLPADDPVIHIGDRLRIVCADVPDLCVDRSVGADGTIDLPALGPAPAATHRANELQRWIAGHLPGGTLPPTVEVQWLGPPPGEVAVLGAVRNPLHVYAPLGIGRDRLLQAAGPLPEADRSLLGPSRRLAAGTTLIVPSVTVDRRISVLGAVATPRSFPPAEAFPLGSAIESSGGLTAHGDSNGIVVVRNGEEIPASLPTDAGYLLRPGDVVRVGLIAERHYVLVKGLVARPGSIEFAPGMTATRALTAAGGLLPKAATGTLVWQSGPKTFRLSIAFLMGRRISDPVLGAEDTITVEAKGP